MSNANSGSWGLALRLARRELRGGLSGFRVFLACLILGVAAIAGIGSLTRSINEGMQAEGRALLGGDMEVRTFRRAATAEEEAWIEQQGELSRAVRMTAMTRAVATERRTLAEVKAVDAVYPLYGNLDLAPAMTIGDLAQQKDGLFGAAIPSNLADRLRVEIGDQLRIGDATFEVRALLMLEPDRASEGFQWGPTVLVPIEAVADMNLLRPGSLYYYHYKLRLAPDVVPVDLREDLRETFPDSDWRVRVRDDSAPGLRRFIEQMGMFLTLVGLSALVVGGVGVGNAVANYLDGKTGTIATFKILGASSSLVFRIYLAQVMILSLAAIAVGLVIGAVTPPMVGAFLPADIPAPAEIGLYPAPLALAVVYGVLITLSFAVWPLAKARDIPAAQLFRSIVSPNRAWPRKRYIFLVGVSALLIIVMAVVFSESPRLAGGFVAGAAIALLVLRGLGYLIQRLAAKLPRPRKPGLRLALANIHRPGAATGAVVLSLGLGLTVFATISLVEGNLSRQVSDQLPGDAPAFFMIDIQKNEADAFRATTDRLEGVGEVRLVPSLRARVTHLAGVAVEDAEIQPGGRWVVRGDRNITYASDIPAGNEVTAGDWWSADYAGPPLVSLAAQEAAELGVGVGDTITMNVLGRTIEAEIANLREFEWGTVSFNFVIIFAPGMLEDAPHHYMASLKIDEQYEAVAHRVLTDEFPGVTSIRMKEVLDNANMMLEQIGAAIRAMAAIAIAAGILVLAGAIAAGHRHRVYDAVILKILGAVRMDVLKAYMIEYITLGLITGGVAIGLGTIAGFVVITGVMEFEYAFMPLAMIQTVGASLLLTVVFGLLGTWRALGAKPTEVLRNSQ